MTHDRHLLRKIICEALEDAGLARQTKAQRGPLIELALGFTWNWAGHLEIVGDDVVKEFLGNASLNWHKDLMRELRGAAGPASVAALRPLTMSGPILIGKDAPLLEIQDIKNALALISKRKFPSRERGVSACCPCRLTSDPDRARRWGRGSMHVVISYSRTTTQA